MAEVCAEGFVQMPHMRRLGAREYFAVGQLHTVERLAAHKFQPLVSVSLYSAAVFVEMEQTPTAAVIGAVGKNIERYPVLSARFFYRLVIQFYRVTGKSYFDVVVAAAFPKLRRHLFGVLKQDSVGPYTNIHCLEMAADNRQHLSQIGIEQRLSAHNLDMSKRFFEARKALQTSVQDIEITKLRPGQRRIGRAAGTIQIAMLAGVNTKVDGYTVGLDTFYKPYLYSMKCEFRLSDLLFLFGRRGTGWGGGNNALIFSLLHHIFTNIPFPLSIFRG